MYIDAKRGRAIVLGKLYGSRHPIRSVEIRIALKFCMQCRYMRALLKLALLLFAC